MVCLTASKIFFFAFRIQTFMIEFAVDLSLSYLNKLLGNLEGKESACNVRCRFDPWVGKISWRRERLLQYNTPVLLPGLFHDRGDWQVIIHGVENLFDDETCEKLWKEKCPTALLMNTTSPSYSLCLFKYCFI